MKRTIITAAVLVLAACSFRTPQNSQTDSTGTAPSAVCTEDQSCWNCQTMGNRICGHPFINGYEAEQAAWEQVQKAGPGWQCWAEVNLEMEHGYEVICSQY